MLAGIKKGAGWGLRLLQSRPFWRSTGRRLVRGITIAHATPADAAYVQSRLNPAFSPSNHPPNPAVTNLIALWHGKIVGFVQLVRHPPSHAPYVGYWLFSLYVLNPLYRGMGIGEALTCALLEIARKENAPEVFLVVNKTNHPAISLYRKMGFQHTALPDLEERLEEEACKTGKRRITMVKRLNA